MVPKLENVSGCGPANSRYMCDLPKGLLNALDVVLEPVTLSNVFLADRNTLPLDSHNGNMVNVVLVKLHVELGEVTGGPLVQTPALGDLLGLLKLEVLAGDVPAKQLKLAADLGTIENLGRGSCKGSDSLGVDKGLVQLLGSGSELLVIGHGSGVDDATSLGLGACGSGGLRGRALGVDLGGRETA